MRNREHWVIYPSAPLSLEGVVIIESRSVRSSSPRLCESAWARQLLELLLRLSLLLLRTFSWVSLLSCTGAVSAEPEPKPANDDAGGFMAKASAVKRLMCMNVNEVLVTKLQDKMVFTTQRVRKTSWGWSTLTWRFLHAESVSKSCSYRCGIQHRIQVNSVDEGTIKNDVNCTI